MPNDIIKIKEIVMDKIQHDEIRMRPRVFFIAGSLLTFLGLVASVVVSVFLVSMIQFSLRTHGPMGQYRFDQMIASFPWWVVVAAIGGLAIGVFLLRKYEFVYKHNKQLIMLGFILAIIFAGIIINATGLDNIWLKRGPMRGMMQENANSRNQGVVGRK